MAAEKTPRKTTTPNSGTSWSSSAKPKAYITVQGHLLAVDGSIIPGRRVRLVHPGPRAPTIVAETRGDVQGRYEFRVDPANQAYGRTLSIEVIGRGQRPKANQSLPPLGRGRVHTPDLIVDTAERLYLGSVEIYREFDTDGATVLLERETLHVMDGEKRIALVETRAQGNDGSPAQAIRYQVGNYLGSAVLELDETAQIVSYEEYFPYSSTSYQAVRIQTETPKRYRYSGEERDEESGLYYHGARYYAPWLGRWISCTGLSNLKNNREEIFAELFGQLILCEINGRKSCTVDRLEYDKSPPLDIQKNEQERVNKIYQSGKTAQEKAIEINDLIADANRQQVESCWQ